MGILTDMSVYTTTLLNYQQKIFLFSNGSWYTTYMDRDNPIVLKKENQNVFLFKKEFDANKRQEGITKLQGDTQQYNDTAHRRRPLFLLLPS